MSLADFKRIYWWEWAHRELGRVIGLVYVTGFLWFALRRAVPGRTVAVLAGMGLLLGTQGVVGWIMVASGLEPGMKAVEPVRLALHLTLAALFFAALVAAYVRLGGAVSERASPGKHVMARAIVVLAFVQVALGGLVAGNDAGLTYNTWPLMDGRLIPSGLGLLETFWANMVANIATVQFNHRIGAYVLTAGILAYAVAARRGDRSARDRGLLLTALVLAQVVVGIATLVHVVPTSLALVHQGLAMILLLALVWNASVLRRRPA
jgi:cytochrome c oxidase assembly protein subunit 15